MVASVVSSKLRYTFSSATICCHGAPRRCVLARKATTALSSVHERISASQHCIAHKRGLARSGDMTATGATTRSAALPADEEGTASGVRRHQLLLIATRPLP
mmetsp:Transcript_44579/g.89914  ORF Transcript_44579/g.89914 Transcript_44579/m.89914 type:complete len:102 (+) Transcript_44579:191-496(+)